MVIWGNKLDYWQEENIRFRGRRWKVLCTAPNSAIYSESKGKKSVLISLLGLICLHAGAGVGAVGLTKARQADHSLLATICFQN